MGSLAERAYLFIQDRPSHLRGGDFAEHIKDGNQNNNEDSTTTGEAPPHSVHLIMKFRALLEFLPCLLIFVDCLQLCLVASNILFELLVDGLSPCPRRRPHASVENDRRSVLHDTSNNVVRRLDSGVVTDKPSTFIKDWLKKSVVST